MNLTVCVVSAFALYIFERRSGLPFRRIAHVRMLSETEQPSGTHLRAHVVYINLYLRVRLSLSSIERTIFLLNISCLHV